MTARSTSCSSTPTRGATRNIPLLKWALDVTAPGSPIVADNVVRDGPLADPSSADPRVHGLRRFHELLGDEARVRATTIQTVGVKGYDGFTLALVLA